MESKLPNSIEELPHALREAIQKLIDEKVQEKFNNFMGEYQDVLTKLKSTAKPTVPPKTARVTGSDSLKPKTGLEGEDTPTAAKTPGTSSVKRPVPTVTTTRPVTAKPRSDSQESSKDKNVVDKKKEAEQKKKEEIDKKKAAEQAKKDELEKKKKEDADKKKKLEERKAVSMPAKGQGKKGKDEGDEDDPIARSLQLRIAAGGVTQVVGKPEKPSIAKTIVAPTVAKIKGQIGKKDAEEEKSVDKPETKKPTTKPGSTVNVVKKSTKVDDDSDDPIAQSLKLREKAGGMTQVIGPAEAKKLGIKIAEKVVDKTVKAIKTAIVENGKKEDKPAKLPTTKPPGPAIGKAQSTVGKKGKDEGEEDDPIALSLKEREKAGGVTQVVAADKDAKKTSTATPKVGGAKAKEEKKVPDTKQPEAKLPATKEKELKEKKEESKVADVKKKEPKPVVEAPKVAQPKVMKGKKKNPDEEKKVDTEEDKHEEDQDSQKQQDIERSEQAQQQQEEQVEQDDNLLKDDEQTLNETEEQEEEQPQEEHEEEEEELPAQDDSAEEQHNDGFDLNEVAQELREITSYISPKQYPSQYDAITKNNAAEKVKSLNDKVMSELMTNEEEIAKLRSTNPDAETQEINNSNFVLQKRSLNSLEVLNDTEFDAEEWLGSSADNSWVIRTLKLWFTLHKNHNQQEWTQFPEILKDEPFYQKAQSVILKVGPEFGKYIESSIKDFDFSEETLYRVQCLISHLGEVSLIDPSCDQSDNAGGAFMMFAIRDALEFAGLLPNRKKIPAREFKLALHKFNYLSSKTEELNRLLATLEEQQ